MNVMKTSLVAVFSSALLTFCAFVESSAEESLVVSFKVRSMYYDPSDKDAFQKKYEGTAINGIPDKDRYHAIRKEVNKDLKGYYGFISEKDAQPKGAISVVVWLERAKDGKFIKTLGRWTGNSSYTGKQPGWAVQVGPVLMIQGDAAGRAYDLFRWSGMYGRKLGSSWSQENRGAGGFRKQGGVDPNATKNPFDGQFSDYDSILGPTVGVPIKKEMYIQPDDPFTLEEDATLLTTAPVIPNRSDDQQPKPWNLKLAWNPKNNKTEETHLPEGDYNIVIEAIEYAMEGEYNNSLSKNKKNTKASQKWLQQFDHFKSIGYTYDGKSWKLRKRENTDDYYATETMSAVAGKKVRGYTNPFTGNKIRAGKNEPAIIYDINVEYTKP